MNTQEAIDFLTKLRETGHEYYLNVSILVPEGPGYKEIKECEQDIRKLGYFTYLKSDHHGDQIVIADRLS